MEHYICTGGCKSASNTEGKCPASDCPMYNEPMETCDCEDGSHYGAFDGIGESDGDDDDE